MAFDPGEIDELVGRVQRSRDTHQFLGFSHGGGQYYPQELLIEEQLPLGEAHTERAPSLATSATRMSPAFDASDRLSVYTSATAPPPLYGPETVGRHRPAVPDPIPTNLPCEFKNFSGCNVVFPSNKVNLWIDHIIGEHLNGCCPKFSICWFCDDGKFGSPSNQGDEMCFRQRLYHIAGHFHDGMTAANIRPDFYFLDHIYKRHLIDESTFEWNRSQGEFPNHHLPRDLHFGVRERPGEVHVEHARSTRRRR
ncbi:hypothetical protein X797_002354 [Metarhizium robertsii]|uniref:Uncharacterized protein n=1 Tax=Metarhizium robertsii TaxID=568076 RepID=A0A0A1V524_9HYPO|nr:hypothetical protein X797_002354 [Metarhizium robertsii]